MTAMLSAMPPRALLFGGPCLRTQRHVASSTVPQAINKQEFITAVKDNVKSSPAIGSLTNVEFEQVVMGVFKTITTKVAAGESVNITGFGKFERRYVPLFQAAPASRRPAPTSVPDQAVHFPTGRERQGLDETPRLKKSLSFQQQ